MEEISHVLQLWQNGLFVVLAVLAGIVLYHYGSKAWKGNVSLTFILGAGLAIVACLMYLLHRHWHLPMGDRATLFVLLYVWCALGLWFFAGRSTSGAKLLLGFCAQAGILYAAFRYI